MCVFRGCVCVQTYEGTFKHPDFGADSIAITVTLEPEGNRGRWECLRQKEEITVDWGDDNSVVLGELKGVTKLKGVADATGTISGSVVQRDREGGHFELRISDKVPAMPTYCPLIYTLPTYSPPDP